MALRAIAILGLVVFLAGVTFQYLVRQEVQRVMSVHVVDKASHLADMLETDERLLDFTPEGQIEVAALSDFALMARSIGVASISVFDGTGALTGHLSTVSEGTSHHEADGGGGGEDHTHHTHDAGHDHMHHAGHDTARLSYLNQLPETGREELASMLASGEDRSVKFDTIESSAGHPINFATVILPLESRLGTRLGFARFSIDSSHIYTAYANGVAILGFLFMGFGVILFGIPAVGFWLQKRATERSTKETEYLFQHDVLTGLLNRTAFSALAETKLQAGEVGFVVYADIDDFKQINDQYGHVVGDAFLKRVANLLRSILGEEASIARLAGDEFGALIPTMPRERIEALCAELLRVATCDHYFDDLVLSATLSIGIAEPKPTDGLDDVLHRADIAHFYAKSGGRNRVSFYEEAMGTAAHRRRLLEARVREACRGREFQLVYQPLVDARNFETVAYEALLRLNDRDGTPIPPFEFVPVAEEIGLIEDIGVWVLNAATRDIAQLDDVSGVSVNLSAEQFRSGRLVDYVRTALRRSGLSPARLELEVTESLLLGEDINASYQIDALKEIGVRIAMDDFGTGFSSLSTLWRYGFDRIKIDKSFVAALNDAPERSRQLIDSIVLLGDRMGMKVTAEGIETDEQKTVLVSLGCDMLQGYYFGRPAPLRSFQIGASDERAS